MWRYRCEATEKALLYVRGVLVYQTPAVSFTSSSQAFPPRYRMSSDFRQKSKVVVDVVDWTDTISRTRHLRGEGAGKVSSVGPAMLR